MSKYGNRKGHFDVIGYNYELILWWENMEIEKVTTFSRVKLVQKFWMR